MLTTVLWPPRFSLKLMWTDPRTTVVNLKNFTENYNYVIEDDISKLWIPGLIFSNAVEETSLKVDEFSSVVVSLVTKAVMNPLEEAFENEIFEGSKNPFRYNRTYELLFRCQFDLSWYPFDSHDCSIDVSPKFCPSQSEWHQEKSPNKESLKSPLNFRPILT